MSTQSLRPLFEAYQAEVADLGNRSLSALLTHTEGEFRKNSLEVAFLGRLSVGKSSLINRLLGRDLLPASAGPATTKLTFIRKGPEETLVARRTDGTETLHVLERDAIASLSQDPEVESLVVTLPDFPYSDVTWVDTPGVEDLDDHTVDVTYGYLPTADAIVFVLDPTQILSKSELEFYETRIANAHRDRLFLVLNKFDLVADEESPEAYMERVAGHLGNRQIAHHQAYPVSARKGFEQGAPLLARFSEALGSYLARTDKQAVLQARLTDAIERAHAIALTELEGVLGGLNREEAELEVDLASMNAELSEADASLQEIEHEIDARIDEIRQDLLIEFEPVAAELLEGLVSLSTPDQKMRYLQTTVPQTLGSFVQTRKNLVEELRKSDLGKLRRDVNLKGLETLAYNQFQHLGTAIDLLGKIFFEPETVNAGQQAGSKPASKKQAAPSVTPPAKKPWGDDDRASARNLIVGMANNAANQRLDGALRELLEEFKAGLGESIKKVAVQLKAEARLNERAQLEAKRNGLARQLELKRSDSTIAARTREDMTAKRDRLEQSFLALTGALRGMEIKPALGA